MRVVRGIREAFARPEYHLLLVANKFQTGFDQPLLCGMYVDKKLGGIQPVADRMLKRYRAPQHARAAAGAAGQESVAKAEKDKLDALALFKADMGAFNRLYAFLSQILDYGNTAIEKRFLFYKRLLPLLEFGRERETVTCPRWR